MRRSPSPLRVLAGFVLAASMFVRGATPADAQTVVVPRFTVADTEVGEIIYGVDVAAGADGALLFTWDERTRDYDQPGTLVRIDRRSTTGAPLPVTAAPVPDTCCTLQRPIAPRVAPYADGHYADLVLGGYTNDVIALGRQRDALGGFLESGWQVDFTFNGSGTHSFGNGGAGATDGVYVVWALWDDLSNQVIGRRLDGIPIIGGPPVVFGPSDPFPFVDVAAVPGGWIVAWGSVHGGQPGTFFARYHTGGASDTVATLDVDTVARALAVSADGARVAVVGTGPKDVDPQTEIWLRFVTPAGAPLGGEILLHTAATAVAPDAAFDESGNLYVVWTENGVGLRALGVDAAGVPNGEPVTLHMDPAVGGLVRTVRTRDAEPFAPSRFVNAWTSFGSGAASGQVATLCTPGTSTCGDGVRDAFCEACDEGPANDDAAADACRTDCRPARCGDGTIDTGEACDDGNRTSCDGCSATCAVEVGFGCGDGIPFPTCGEPCDDGNTVTGDGCSPGCALELVPGGGSPAGDCRTVFTVANPGNQPLLDSRGQFRTKHVCVDDDPACDQDGGTPGGCTFAVRVCANATTLPGCTPNGRLSSWTLNAPSATNAAKKPALAAVRDALLAGVPSTIVGPDGNDVCSAPVPVVVELRGAPGAWRQGKVAIKTTARLYDGTKDSDKLDLRCEPAP